MRESDLVAGGYPSIDRIVKIRQKARTGHTAIIENRESFHPFFGGCAVNVCVLLSRLGWRTLPLIRVGDDYETSGYKEHMESAGVHTDAVERVEGEITSYTYLIEDAEREHITLFYPGAMDERHARPFPEGHVRSARYALTTANSRTDNAHFIKQCLQHDIPLAFGMKADYDAFPKDFLEEILATAEIIFMNTEEEASLKNLFGLSDICDLFTHDRLKTLVVTRGAEGSLSYKRGDEGIGSFGTPAVAPQRVVDTTGSGDAFIAGYLHGVLSGASARDSALYGSVMASFIIEKTGCTTNAPTKQAFMKRLNENKDRRIP